jgi:hypothetical protein
MAVARRRLMALLGLLTIIGGLIYITYPVGHIPPYDANLVRLAESNLQGYCSGQVLIQTQGVGDANMAAQCRAQRKKQRSDSPQLSAVQPAFCEAIVDSKATGLTQSQCMDIMTMNEYWPTYNGSITNSWNSARPYPALLSFGSNSTSGGGSRTGTHAGNSRNINPSH